MANFDNAIKYAALKKQLEDDNKHIMLSYQWDSQELVKKVHDFLKSKGLSVWMDIHGGIVGNIVDSMSEAVQNAAVIVPFMTEAYEKSENCRQELEYARVCKVKIIPCYISRGYAAKAWLGFVIAGKKYITISEAVEAGAEELLTEISYMLVKPSADAAINDEHDSNFECISTYEDLPWLLQPLQSVQNTSLSRLPSKYPPPLNDISPFTDTCASSILPKVSTDPSLYNSNSLPRGIGFANFTPTDTCASSALPKVATAPSLDLYNTNSLPRGPGIGFVNFAPTNSPQYPILHRNAEDSYFSHSKHICEETGSNMPPLPATKETTFTEVPFPMGFIPPTLPNYTEPLIFPLSALLPVNTDHVICDSGHVISNPDVGHITLYHDNVASPEINLRQGSDNMYLLEKSTDLDWFVEQTPTASEEFKFNRTKYNRKAKRISVTDKPLDVKKMN